MRLGSTMQKLRQLVTKPETRRAIALTTAGGMAITLLVPDQPIHLRRMPSDAEADKKREEIEAFVKQVKEHELVKPAHERLGRQVASTRFKRGDWWEWEYKDGQQQTTSWEVGKSLALPAPVSPADGLALLHPSCACATEIFCP